MVQCFAWASSIMVLLSTLSISISTLDIRSYTFLLLYDVNVMLSSTHMWVVCCQVLFEYLCQIFSRLLASRASKHAPGARIKTHTDTSSDMPTPSVPHGRQSKTGESHIFPHKNISIVILRTVNRASEHAGPRSQQKCKAPGHYRLCAQIRRACVASKDFCHFHQRIE